jgi:Dihydroxynaphthoic acid synthase
MNFEDILYEVKNGVAWITINRPEKMNAFRGTTCDELIKALNKAGYDRNVGAIVLAGAGEKAFCTVVISLRMMVIMTVAVPLVYRWKNCIPPFVMSPNR